LGGKLVGDVFKLPLPDLFLRSAAVNWTAEAEAKLKEIPFFVRPAARKKIEKLAIEMGAEEITGEIYDAAKKKFG
jgi:hypothetical protein